MNAKMSELKVGDTVEVIGFDCMEGHKGVLENGSELYVQCCQGRHYLSGQLDDADNDTLVGIFKV